MPSTEAVWLLVLDLPSCDRRFGAEQVDRVLQDPRDHAAPPQVDSAGRLAASLVRGPRDVVPRAGDLSGAPTALRLRLRGDGLEIACECSRGRSYVCEHVVRVMVDLAVHPALRAALAAGEDMAAIGALLEELPALRREAFEERTLEERLACWIPPRTFEDDFEIDVEPVRSASLAAREERPALVLRHRRTGARALVRAKDVTDARLRPWHRRLIELSAPGHMDRSSLVATRAQASLLLHLLQEQQPIYTRSFKSRLRFMKDFVVPRVDPRNGRLVARWTTSDGRAVADAEDALLFTGPFPFLWSETGEAFHPVAPEVDLDVAWGLSRVPSLPLTARSRERVGRALLMGARSLGVKLPGPEVFGLPPLEAPSFELRLRGTPLDVRGELHAVYRAATVPVARRGEDAAHRDLGAEEQALEMVREAGFATDEDDEGVLRITDERAVALWSGALATLRESTAPRFAVLVDDALARVKVGPPLSFGVHVAEASGWLDTELTFRAGALKVELGILRRVLAERGRWVTLSDGALSRISDEVAALVDEAAAFGDDGHGRLAAHQLGRVERWVDRFGGELDEHTITLRARLRSLAVRTQPDLPSRLDATLRPYQLRGLAWLQFLRELGAGGVLADDMGLGKTLMTLALVARWKDDAGSAPSLVVCPTSVVSGWAKEAARFVPQLRVLVLHGAGRHAGPAAIAEADLVITTYAVLRRDIDALARRRFRCAILDEAQNVKNPTAATSRAARRLDAQLRLALSGTPVENRLGELWSILSFANPGMLGERRAFEDRYQRPIANQPGGAVAAELRALVRPFVLRRTKAEVLSDLPPKTEIDLACVFGLRQKRLYDALALALREAVKKKIETRGLARSRLSVLTAILRLRQMACDPRLVDPSVPATESAKRAAFLELVRELVAEGRRALVFSQFVELFTLWRADLEHEKIAYEYLDGSSTDREAIVDRFQSGSAPLFLVSLKAGGAGLNLTAADTVIHCDPWWNPAVEDQATDRAHRLGQTRAVTVVRLVAQGTIEDKIGLLKTKKRELALAVLGDDPGEAALHGITDDDVRLLLDGLGVEAAAPTAEPRALGEPLVRRFVPPREIDDLRAILRAVESSGTPRKDLARRVGLPLARVSLLLIGHRVPITTRAAERIRGLRDRG